MNNANTKKEAVGRTYSGVDGYTPSATYLGKLGYCLELALRPRVQHSTLETELNLERVLPMAVKLTPMPLLFRADSGQCSGKIMRHITQQACELSREIAFIIKWNPRKTPVEATVRSIKSAVGCVLDQWPAHRHRVFIALYRHQEREYCTQGS